ncbi:MAG: phosphoribosylglycinamide formyltransferase 2, partial [Methylococcales bacterium]
LSYHGLEKALSVPNTDVRLFGKPEAFVNRRMGVALAIADTADTARKNAANVANLVVITAD